MNDEHAEVVYAAILANGFFVRAKHYLPVCALATLPVEMLVAKAPKLVFPSSMARLVTEEEPLF